MSTNDPLGGLRVGQVMSPYAPCVGEDVTLAEAALILTECGLSAISVCDEEGNATGLVTDRDIARAIAQGEDPWMLEPTAMRTGHGDDPTPLHPDDALQDAISIMVRHQLWHLPVILQEEPVGTLHLADVLALWPAQQSQRLPHLTAEAGARATP